MAPVMVPIKPAPAETSNKPKAARASYTPSAAPDSSESWLGAFLDALWDAIRYTFYVAAAFVVLANTRRILRFIDSVFEVSPQEQPAGAAGHDLQTEAVAASLTLDLRDLVQSEFSAADYRKQTKLLRALKDKLDADAEAARATIRRERARAQQQQPRKEVA